ncbi:hypothetical protein ACFLXB_08325, partial [Chloroflexota bacterium]
MADERTEKETQSKAQGELLFNAQQRTQRIFKLNVAASWILLILFLIFLFSGIEFSIGNAEFSTIQLDTEFIKENLGFIASGIGVTIGISLLSILLATFLALLSALGRLSKFPP